MNFIDFLVLVALFVFLWMGSRRGVVMEFFELLIVTFNVLLCSHLYGFLSLALARFLKMPGTVADAVSFLLFFILFAAVLWILAGKAQIITNIPPSNEFNRMGGTILALMKGFVLVWVIFFLVSLAPVSKENRKPFHESRMVAVTENLNGVMDTLVLVAGSPEFYKMLHPKIKKFAF